MLKLLNKEKIDIYDTLDVQDRRKINAKLLFIAFAKDENN